jgi:putative peptidoglycan lipid II flippase
MSTEHRDPSRDDAPATQGTDPDADSARSLAANVRTVGLWTFVSRILGMLRDALMATAFGNGPILDAFSVAFRIPNLFRRLFGEGALTAAFLPAFLRERQQRGERAGWQLATAVFVALFGALVLVVVAAELLLWGTAVAFDLSPSATFLLQLTALLLPYVVLVCVSAQVSAVLHALGHFTVPALLPIVLNVIWIAGLVWLVPGFETAEQRMFAVSVVIVLAGVLQMLAPWPILFAHGYRPDLGDAALRSAEGGRVRARLREIVGAMLPVLVGLSLTQLNTLADSLIAWGFSAPGETLVDGVRVPTDGYPLEAGTAAALYLGQRMYQFPLGVFGVALGTVLFPLLARHAEQGRVDLVRDDLGLGLRLTLAIGLPASLGLVLLAGPVTDLLFRHGRFDAHDAAQTAAMIAAYGTAVWAYSAVHVLQRAYYAIDDRITPMRIGLFGIAFNIALNFALLWPFGGPGLAYATAVTAVLHVGLLAAVVQGHVGRLDWESLAGTTVRVTLATALMGAACLLALRGVDHVTTGDGTTVRSLRVLLPFTAAIATYLVAARLLVLDEVWLLLRRGRPRSRE